MVIGFPLTRATRWFIRLAISVAWCDYRDFSKHFVICCYTKFYFLGEERHCENNVLLLPVLMMLMNFELTLTERVHRLSVKVIN